MAITKPLSIGGQRALLVTLRQVLADAKMERANFSLIAGTSTDDPLPVRESEVTEFIKRRTRLYRDSWIIGPLEEAIRDLEESE